MTFYKKTDLDRLRTGALERQDVTLLYRTRTSTTLNDTVSLLVRFDVEEFYVKSALVFGFFRLLLTKDRFESLCYVSDI